MKITFRDNYRIVIEPDSIGNMGICRMSDYFIEPDPIKRAKRYKEACEDILKDCKKHIDNVGNIFIESDIIESCEYCNAGWTEESPYYNGGCCIKDIENNPDLAWRKND
jgi:hypothetical protein